MPLEPIVNVPFRLKAKDTLALSDSNTAFNARTLRAEPLSLWL